MRYLIDAGGSQAAALILCLAFFVLPTLSAKDALPKQSEAHHLATTPGTFLQLAPPPAGQLIISEFRLRGALGAYDEFIEIYNNTDTDITVDAGDTSTGFALVSADDPTTAKFVIPNGTVIPARGHFLGINSVGYSLSANAAGDVTYTTDIPDNRGIALFNSNTPADWTAANRLDAVGAAGEANTVYKEGTGYPNLQFFSLECSFYRTLLTGVPKDTEDNASDFLFVDTNGTSAGAGQRLGAPGPENLSSPTQHNNRIKASLVDPQCSGYGPLTSACARVRTAEGANPTNATRGTLHIRRKFTNNLGVDITRLRFRIVEIATFPAPTGVADLRVLTSTDTVVTVTGGSTATIRGLTLEEPPSQPFGGGFNSTLSAGMITLETPLAAGASINVNFLLGVEQSGTFTFFVNVEATP
jgi:hypothetical protein